MKNKIYVAVVGSPDSGKSTFISRCLKLVGKETHPDTLCDEHILERTIRSAQVVLHEHHSDSDIVFLDTPGHIEEYPEEIYSCLSKAHVVLLIRNIFDNASIEFTDVITPVIKGFNKPLIMLSSHSTSCLPGHYDAIETGDTWFCGLLDEIRDKELSDALCNEPVDPVETAARIVKETIKLAVNPVVMCSWGKDSIMMLDMFKKLDLLDKVTVAYPYSGYDLPGINREFIEQVCEHFDIKEVRLFNVTKRGESYNNTSVEQMMLNKAECLTEFVNKHGYDMVYTGIRRDEEGTRAKEKFVSPRGIDGSFLNTEPQLELVGNEVGIIHHYKKHDLPIGHWRINPLLDMTELDVWKEISSRGLPVCRHYFADNGKRYRSLGDYQVTTPIDSLADSVVEICNELEVTTIPERACRQLQDTATTYGMEEYRKKGFF